MKIFIGGMKPHHQQKFVQEYPSVEFTFAAFDDSWATWVREAGKAAHIIVDQSRCNHKTVDHLRACNKAQLYFTDSKAMMRQIIDGLLRDGTYGQGYIAWVAA